MQICRLFLAAFWNFWRITRLSTINHLWVINAQRGPVFLANPVLLLCCVVAVGWFWIYWSNWWAEICWHRQPSVWAEELGLGLWSYAKVSHWPYVCPSRVWLRCTCDDLCNCRERLHYLSQHWAISLPPTALKLRIHTVPSDLQRTEWC